MGFRAMRENYESKKPIKRHGKQGDHFPTFSSGNHHSSRGRAIIVISELFATTFSHLFGGSSFDFNSTGKSFVIEISLPQTILC